MNVHVNGPALMASDATCPHNPEVNCASCRLSRICLPIAIAAEDVVQLDEIVERGRPLKKSDFIYRQNDSFSSVYAVRSGAVKTYRITPNGEQQVTGFYLPGEIFGVDGIGTNCHASSAVALDTSAICEIPFAQLETLSLRLPSLQRHFFQILSQEITEDQRLLTLVNKNRADERLAAFLLSISARNAKNGLSSQAFILPMPRADIACFLGLTIETISRVFSKFKKAGIISVDGRSVEVLDMCGLKLAALVE